jgi:hypothetical protein
MSGRLEAVITLCLIASDPGDAVVPRPFSSRPMWAEPIVGFEDFGWASYRASRKAAAA